jgi:hypothetical protein
MGTGRQSADVSQQQRGADRAGRLTDEVLTDEVLTDEVLPEAVWSPPSPP